MKRFWEKVNKRPNGCWLWKAGKDWGGYGIFWLNGKSVKAHRFSWAFHFIVLPKGMHVCHRCDNPSCVNPAHLFLGTDRENQRDAAAKGRKVRGEKHYRAKLTREQVLLIRKLRMAGLTLQTLSRLFGVSQSQVGNIVRRESWRSEQ